MRKTLVKLGAVVLAAGVTFTGAAQAAEASSQKHADASVQYRKALFQLIRSNMAPLGGMAKGAIPYDAEVMGTNALRLEQLAAMVGDYMKTDTRKFDVDTDAKDEVWDNFADVEKKAMALGDAAKGLQTVVAAGDESAYRAAIGKIGSTCKSCHDDYKKD